MVITARNSSTGSKKILPHFQPHRTHQPCQKELDGGIEDCVELTLSRTKAGEMNVQGLCVRLVRLDLDKCHADGHIGRAKFPAGIDREFGVLLSALEDEVGVKLLQALCPMGVRCLRPWQSQYALNGCAKPENSMEV